MSISAILYGPDTSDGYRGKLYDQKDPSLPDAVDVFLQHGVSGTGESVPVGRIGGIQPPLPLPGIRYAVAVGVRLNAESMQQSPAAHTVL